MDISQLTNIKLEITGKNYFKILWECVVIRGSGLILFVYFLF